MPQSRTGALVSAIADIPPHPGGRLAVFGRETFYVAGLYLRQAAIFAGLGLAIVISLDGASNAAAVLSAPVEQSGLDGPLRLAYYLFLRGGYVLSSILPIGAIVGVVWAEFILAASRERIMIANSGRSPLRSLIPAVVFGLILGALQFVAIAYGRPASVEAQSTSNFRYYGPRFLQPVTTDQQWLAAGQSALHARVEIDTTVSLRDVLLYSFDGQGRLEAIVSAERATPGPTPGIWTFEQGSTWDLARIAAGGSDAMRMESADFASLRRPLQLEPVWLKNLEVLPQLLPQEDLVVLASGRPGIPSSSEYEAAYHERFAGIFFCVGMALLGASLSLLTFAPGMGPMPALKVGIAGGLAYVGTNASSLLGTYGIVAPILAAWSMPVTLIVLSISLIYARHQRARAQLRELFSRR
jgi:lipopolysaccharide export system permease protein